MRVAIVTGVLVDHDAISNAVRLEQSVLLDAGHEVSVHCQGTTEEDNPDIFTGADAWQMTRRAHYRDADLVILHFGTGYELFDALLINPEVGMKRVVRFHNVTPPRLLAGVHRRRAQEGLDQVVIAERADHIWCDSLHNQLTLVELGIDESATSILRLCVPGISGLIEKDWGAFPDVPRLLYVGRMVRAKGVLDLLAAYRSARLADEGVELWFAGNTSQSDPEVLAVLRTASERDAHVHVVDGPSALELSALYESASVFAMPSYHEGFCVPVIEALAHGIPVVASDAGALPDTLGGAGRLVPAGNVDMLASELRTAVKGAQRGGLRRPDERRLRVYTSASFEDRLLEAVGILTAERSVAVYS